MSFYSNFRHYLSSSLLVSLLGVISLPVLTRLFGKADLGYIFIFNTSVNIFSIIVGLNLFHAFPRYYYEDNKQVGPFISTLIITFLALGAVCSVAIYFWGAQMSAWLKVPPDLIPYTVLFSVANCFFLLQEKYFVATKESKKSLLYALINSYGLFLFTLVYLFVIREFTYVQKIHGDLIFKTGLGLWIVIVFLRRFKVFTFSREAFGYAASYAIPRLMFGLCMLLVNQVDRYMLNYYISAAETADYSIAYSLGALVMIGVSATSSSSMAYYFEGLKNGDHAGVDKINKGAFSILVLLAILISLGSQELYVLFVSSKYIFHPDVIMLIILGFVFNGIASQYSRIFDYVKKTYFLSVLSAMILVVKIGLNYVLIPRMGIFGASLSSALVFVMFSLLAYIVSLRMVKVHTTPLKAYAKDLLLLFAFVGAAYGISSIEGRLLLVYGLKAITVGAVLFLYRKNILQLVGRRA